MSYLTQGLHRALQAQPDRIALRHLPADGAEAVFSFAELAHAIARCAAALRDRGIGRGDRVALLAHTSDRLIVQIHACWWLGACACPLNVRWSLPELRHAVADCDPQLLVADAGFAAIAAELASDVSVIGHDALHAAAAACEPLPDSRSGGDTLACLLYTGGTTGRAKGVMLSHANLWSAAIARAATLPTRPESVGLLVAPLFHVAGMARLVGQWIAGAACVSLPGFVPQAVLDAVERHRVSDVILVPTMLQALLDAPGFDAARVQSLSRIAFGAAPMPPGLLDRALAVWPGAEFFQAYGLTETAGAVCINPPADQRSDDPAVRASVGRAGLGAEFRVVDGAGRDLPAGAVGELLVRGPMVTAGYWRQPEATAAAIDGGWLATGDAALLSADGRLTIVDRLKDMVISGGENVYSIEVETALRSHPRVADVAVIGVPHRHWGEAVHAVVIARGDTGAASHAELQAELQAWCRERIAGYKCPRSYAFVTALPLSAAGKVLKAELRRMSGHIHDQETR